MLCHASEYEANISADIKNTMQSWCSYVREGNHAENIRASRIQQLLQRSEKVGKVPCMYRNALKMQVLRDALHCRQSADSHPEKAKNPSGSFTDTITKKGRHDPSSHSGPTQGRHHSNHRNAERWRKTIIYRSIYADRFLCKQSLKIHDW